MKRLLAFLMSLLMAGSMLSPGLPAFAESAVETSQSEEEDTGTEILPPCLIMSPRPKVPGSWTSHRAPFPSSTRAIL